MLDVLQDKTVKARKQHRCSWCGEHINPKERYRLNVVIFEGELQRNKYHPECFGACSEYFHLWPMEDGYDPHSGIRGKPEVRE